MTNTGKKTWILIGAAVAVLAGIIWYAAARNPAGAPAGGNAAVNQQSVGVPVFAPKGELVSGFPQSLILDPAAVITNSYSIHYSSTTNQYTAQWNSSSSMVDLYNTYKQYLAANGWTTVNESTRSAVTRGIYARDAAADVSIAIIMVGKGLQVSVTYVAK